MAGIAAASGPRHTYALSPGIPRDLFPPDEPEGLGKDSLPESKFHPQGDLASINDETEVAAKGASPLKTRRTDG